MPIYAKDTSVSVEKTRAEIESTLARYGATAFAYATDQTKAVIKFQAQNRIIRFMLPLPDREDRMFTHGYAGRGHRRLPPDEIYRKWEQGCRQRWRALGLAIKAKLEAVQSGIATFEEEFLSYIMLPNGKTVGEMSAPKIESAYQSGQVGNLLEFKE